MRHVIHAPTLEAEGCTACDWNSVIAQTTDMPGVDGNQDDASTTDLLVAGRARVHLPDLHDHWTSGGVLEGIEGTLVAALDQIAGVGPDLEPVCVGIIHED